MNEFAATYSCSKYTLFNFYQPCYGGVGYNEMQFSAFIYLF